MKRLNAMPRRTLLIIAAAATAAVAGLLAVAWYQLDPGPLHRIVVSNVVYGGSDFWQITIDDSDHYVYEHHGVEDRGRIAFAPFAAQLAPAYELRLFPSGSADARDGLGFWVEGSRRTVAPFIPALYTGHTRVRDFASALHEAVVADFRRKNKPRIDALTSLRDLRTVEAESKGCYGPCGIYTITLRSDRSGTLVWHDAARVTQHRANRIDWNIVRAALHDAHVERLERFYASRAVDTQAATLYFTFPKLGYLVEAPDSSTWPQEFRDAFRELRHAAARATWSPPLSAYETERLAR
ncbi:MAG: hypothetical protein JWM87_507 [Candidatus Eremiobacteraeota bacterium]|nr:hypothetical protein [Candidatus Eremiobacteraeota bacterium]